MLPNHRSFSQKYVRMSIKVLKIISKAPNTVLFTACLKVPTLNILMEL